MSKARTGLRQQDTEKPQEEERDEELVKKAMANYTKLSAKYSPDFQINPAFANYIKSMPCDFLFDVERLSCEGKTKIQEAKKAKESKELKASQFTRMVLEEEKSILPKMKAILHDLEGLEISDGVESIFNVITFGDVFRSLMGDFLFLAKLYSEVIYSFDKSNSLYGQDQQAKLNADIASVFYEDPVIFIAVKEGLLSPREEEKGTFWVEGTLRETMERWMALLMNSPNPNLQKTETFHTTKLAKILFSRKTRRPYSERAITLATDGLYPKRISPKKRS